MKSTSNSMLTLSTRPKSSHCKEFKATLTICIRMFFSSTEIKSICGDTCKKMAIRCNGSVTQRSTKGIDLVYYLSGLIVVVSSSREAGRVLWMPIRACTTCCELQRLISFWEVTRPIQPTTRPCKIKSGS